MDVVASHQAGVKAAVATSGTALTSQQLKQLSGLAKRVVLAFDSDRAGLAATKRAVPLAQRLGLELFALRVEGAKDADELIKKGPQLWHEAVEQAKEIREYWLECGRIEFDVSSSLGRRQFVDSMSEVARLYAASDEQDELSGDETSVDQDIFISRVAEISGMEIETVKKAVRVAAAESVAKRPGSAVRRGSSTATEPSESPISATPPVRRNATKRPAALARERLEQIVLAIVLTHLDTRAILDELSEQDFSQDIYRQVFTGLKMNRHEPGESLAKSLTELSKDISILLLIGEQQLTTLNPQQRGVEAFELARRLRNLSNRDLKQQLIAQMQEAERSGDKGLIENLTNRIQKINEEEA
jgi:DNA primase